MIQRRFLFSLCMLIATATTSFAIDKEQIKEAAKAIEGIKQGKQNHCE